MNTINTYNKKDKIQGVIFSSSFFMVVFGILFLVKINQTKEKPQVAVEIDFEIPLEAYEEPTPPKIKDLTVGGGAAGSAADLKYNANPPAQVEKVLTNSTGNSTTQSGKGNVTTGTDVDQVGTTSNVSKNPFGTGGSNGNTGTGKFGSDFGPGSGKGNGSGHNNTSNPPRKIVSSPNFEVIKADESCLIYLKLIIDANGNVTKAFNIAEKSTTKDNRIISEVITMVKRSLKYDSRNGVTEETVFCPPITVTAQ